MACRATAQRSKGWTVPPGIDRVSRVAVGVWWTIQRDGRSLGLSFSLSLFLSLSLPHTHTLPLSFSLARSLLRWLARGARDGEGVRRDRRVRHARGATRAARLDSVTSQKYATRYGMPHF